MSRPTDYRIAHPHVIRWVDRAFRDPQVYTIYSRCPDPVGQQLVAHRPALDGRYGMHGIRFVDDEKTCELMKQAQPQRPPMLEGRGKPKGSLVGKVVDLAASYGAGRNGTLQSKVVAYAVVMVGTPIIEAFGLAVNQREYTRRLTVCRDCDYFQEVTQTAWQCRKCGCSGNVKARLKSDDPDLTCPLEKW